MRATCASPQTENRIRYRSSTGQALYGSIYLRQCQSGGYLRQRGDRRVESRLIVGLVAELTGFVVDVSLHIEMSMAAQIKEDRARGTLRFAAQRLLDDAAHRMVGFGSW